MLIRSLTPGCAVLVLAVAGCGGGAVPHSQLAKTEAEIRAAEVKVQELKEAGPSEGTPVAELHLKLANDEVKQGRALIKENQNEDAAGVLRRAEMDASYALALAREWEAKARAAEAQKKLQELKEKTGEGE